MKRRIAIGMTMLMSFAMVAGTAGVSATADEGCTPGYWKQAQHFDSWPYTEIDPEGTWIRPEHLSSAYFGGDLFPNKTLLQVLKQGGGGKKALGRHAVAAFLNAHSDAVEYGQFPEDVVAAVAWAAGKDKKWAYNAKKNQLEAFNQLGCPLN